VLFIGTTRDSFNDLPVSSLAYTAYAPLAMATLWKIAEEVLARFGVTRVAIAHKVSCLSYILFFLAGWEVGSRRVGGRSGEEKRDKS
jgi:molybdopterin synthase catalytic subunit